MFYFKRFNINSVVEEVLKYTKEKVLISVEILKFKLCIKN